MLVRENLCFVFNRHVFFHRLAYRSNVANFTYLISGLQNYFHFQYFEENTHTHEKTIFPLNYNSKLISVIMKK